jgi:flavin reductase (DIM6/NTAB) family NADH-FMN oxidoreductase RutF
VADDVTSAYDAVVGAFDGAMVVVTAADGEERDGCLVGFHTQVSIEPRRHVVWLSVANRTFRIAQRSTHLAVHAIGEDQHDLAELLGGQTGDEVDKLAGVEWAPGPGGVPLLDALPVHVVGRIVMELEVPDADHVGFVLEPVAPAAASADDLVPLRLRQATDIDPGHPV